MIIIMLCPLTFIATWSLDNNYRYEQDTIFDTPCILDDIHDLQVYILQI